MKKAPLAAFISALLISALAGTMLVNFSMANPYPPDEGPFRVSVTITSPENKTYPNGNIPLAFTVDLTYDKRYWIFQNIALCTYSLNGKKVDFFPSQTRSGDAVYCSTTLNGIPEGSHNLTIIAQANFLFTYLINSFTPYGISKAVSFTINAQPPKITILSTQDKTYSTSDVSLSFTVSEPVSWMGYSLDGSATVTISGNTTLTGLPEGTHNITVYATDTAGTQGASKTTQFTITQETQPQQDTKTEPQQSTPFPTTLIAAAAVVSVAAVVGAALLVQFRKRKRKAEKVAA